MDIVTCLGVYVHLYAWLNTCTVMENGIKYIMKVVCVCICVCSFFRIWNMQMRWRFFASTTAPTCFQLINGTRRPSSNMLDGGATSNTIRLFSHTAQMTSIPQCLFLCKIFTDSYLYYIVHLYILYIFEKLLKNKVNSWSSRWNEQNVP